MVFPALKTKNTMLFAKLYNITTIFSANSKNAELVRLIFLTNSAQYKVLKHMLLPHTLIPLFSH